jgi:hypothetical protein
MFIKLQIAKNIRSSIPDSETAKGYLTSIEQQFVSSDKALASTLMAKLSSLKHSGGSIREHIMEMRDIASQLKGLECTFSDSFLVHYILNSLPPQYGPFKISYNTHKDKWSINEFLTMCVQEEGRLAQERQNIVHTVDTVSHTEGKYKKRTWNNSFKGKSGPMWKKAKDARTGPNQTRENGVTCFFWKKAGRVKKDCHKYHKWLEKKGMFALFHELNFISVPSNSWWVDSAATCHVSCTVQGFLDRRKPNPDEAAIFTGQGMPNKVEFIGTLRLVLNNGHLLDLKDTFYMSAVTVVGEYFPVLPSITCSNYFSH